MHAAYGTVKCFDHASIVVRWSCMCSAAWWRSGPAYLRIRAINQLQHRQPAAGSYRLHHQEVGLRHLINCNTYYVMSNLHLPRAICMMACDGVLTHTSSALCPEPPLQNSVSILRASRPGRHRKPAAETRCWRTVCSFRMMECEVCMPPARQAGLW